MKITGDNIKIDRELSEMDNFALDFCSVIEKIVDYVIVSGYVSIILGRARASEDIDMIIPKLKKEEWKKVHNSLIKKGYYCLNTGKVDEELEYLEGGIAVRFAPLGKVIPNMEVSFAKKKTQLLALQTKRKVSLAGKEIFISDLELQIAYKEIILRSPKDMEDARHLRNVLGKDLNFRKLKEYEKALK